MEKIFLSLLITLATSIILIAKANESLYVKQSGWLSGRNLTIGTITDLPYVGYGRDDNGNLIDVIGYVPKMVEWLSAKYNFTYVLIEPPDGRYGAMDENGSWNGLVGMLRDGVIDMVATDLSITFERSAVVEYTNAFSNEPMSLQVEYPKLASTIGGLVRPFQYEVWVGIVISLGVTAVFLGLVKKVESRVLSNQTEADSEEDEILSLSWLLFRVYINPTDILNYTLSAKLLIAGWCLAAFVIVQSYSSCLVSYLMAPKFIPFINTIDDMVNKDVPLMVYRGSSMETAIKEATTGQLAKLGSILRSHPEGSVESMENDTFNGRRAAVYERGVLQYYAYQDFLITKECRMAIAKEYLYEDRVALALPKSSRLIKAFNIDLMIMQESGLIEHWAHSYKPKDYRCTSQLITLRPDTTNEKLSLDFLSSAFLLYGVGIILSIVVLLIEIVHNFFRSKNNSPFKTVSNNVINVRQTRPTVLK